jgi:hypothetical protein
VQSVGREYGLDESSNKQRRGALFNYLFGVRASEMLPVGSRHIRRERPLTWKFTRNNTHTCTLGGKNCPRPFTSQQFALDSHPCAKNKEKILCKINNIIVTCNSSFEVLKTQYLFIFKTVFRKEIKFKVILKYISRMPELPKRKNN